MTEPKNENNEVATPEHNGLFNYTNKLPDNLTNKDMDYLRKRIDSGLPTDNPKSKRIKSTIESYITDKANLEDYNIQLASALGLSIIFSIGLIFGGNGLVIGNLFIPLCLAIIALAGSVRNNENTLTAYSILENKYNASLLGILYRNIMPVIALLVPVFLLYGLYEGHQKDPAQVKDVALIVVICIGAYLVKKISRMTIAHTLKKYKTGE